MTLADDHQRICSALLLSLQLSLRLVTILFSHQPERIFVFRIGCITIYLKSKDTGEHAGFHVKPAKTNAKTA